MTPTPVNCFQAKIVFEFIHAKICRAVESSGVAMQNVSRQLFTKKINAAKMLRYRNLSRFVSVLATLTIVSHGNVEKQTF